MSEKRILVVEDRAATRRMLEETLGDEGYVAVGVENGESAIDKIRGESFDAIVTDLELPGMGGLQVLAASKENDPMAPVIVLTAHGTVENAVKAMKEGAYEFLTKPVDTDRLLLLLERANERRSLELRSRALTDGAPAPIIAGESTAIRSVLRLADRVAASDATVMLLGESGTGKELFARYIHSRSKRSGDPMVAVNCAAIPRELIEAELFGSEKGAYTGADRTRIGKFELAHGGTLFFDEIGDLEQSLQSKLLRVLEDGAVERVGGSRTIRVDVRLVAATNKPLEQAVAAREFREDLYYRLNVFPLHLPPLRDRRDDIPIIAEQVLTDLAREMGRPPMRLTSEAREKLLAYEWRGNVRELRNALERAVILVDGEEITADMLPRESENTMEPELVDNLHAAVRIATRRTEVEMIRRILAECGGNKSEAARRMKVSYRSLWSKIKEYGIQ